LISYEQKESRTRDIRITESKADQQFHPVKSNQAALCIHLHSGKNSNNDNTPFRGTWWTHPGDSQFYPQSDPSERFFCSQTEPFTSTKNETLGGWKTLAPLYLTHLLQAHVKLQVPSANHNCHDHLTRGVTDSTLWVYYNCNGY